MKEDQIRKKQREFVPVTRIPKITREELRQEKNDIFDEEQIKKLNEKYLSNGLNQIQKQIFIYKIVLFILFMVLCLTFYKNDKHYADDCHHW